MRVVRLRQSQNQSENNGEEEIHKASDELRQSDALILAVLLRENRDEPHSVPLQASLKNTP